MSQAEITAEDCYKFSEGEAEKGRIFFRFGVRVGVKPTAAKGAWWAHSGGNSFETTRGPSPPSLSLSFFIHETHET